METREGMRLN